MRERRNETSTTGWSSASSGRSLKPELGPANIFLRVDDPARATIEEITALEDERARIYARRSPREWYRIQVIEAKMDVLWQKVRRQRFDMEQSA